MQFPLNDSQGSILSFHLKLQGKVKAIKPQPCLDFAGGDTGGCCQETDLDPYAAEAAQFVLHQPRALMYLKILFPPQNIYNDRIFGQLMNVMS